MPKLKRKLTDIHIGNLLPQERNYRVYFGLGLYLEITPKGSKYWRFKYRFANKEKLLSLGVWPEVKLAEAERSRSENRAILAQKIDPSDVRRADKQQVNFKDLELDVKIAQMKLRLSDIEKKLSLLEKEYKVAYDKLSSILSALPPT